MKKIHKIVIINSMSLSNSRSNFWSLSWSENRSFFKFVSIASWSDAFSRPSIWSMSWSLNRIRSR